jgi:hypothetical protein
VWALDRGDLVWAHDQLSPAMKQKDGWGYAQWSDFWRGYLVGASVHSVEDVDTHAMRVTAVVDYHLTGGEFSRELLEVGITEGPDRRLLIGSYDVVRAERHS